MDDRAVRPGARNAVERQVAKLGRFAAQRLEMVRRLQLVDVALGRFLVDPVQEARDRRAVALLRGLLAGDLGRVLDRLGQDRRVAQRQDLGAGLVERVEDRRDRALGIDHDGLALELAERAFELGALVEAHAVAEMLADVGADLLAGDEQVGGAVGIDQRIGQRDRRVGHVRAADVERPGDRIERGQHRRVGVLLGQPVGDLGALLGRRLAGILVGLDDEMGLRRLGPVLPDLVDRIAARPATSSAPRLASASFALFTQSRVCSHGS